MNDDETRTDTRRNPDKESGGTHEHEKFKLKHLPSLLKTTAIEWNKDDPWRLSAVVAYYALLSLPGLLVIIINSVGAIWGREIVTGELSNQISSAIGPEAAESIRNIISETQGGEKSLISTIIGIATLIFGATGVFFHLQISINKVWEIKTDPEAGIKKMLLDRAQSFAFILVIGFLLLVSFILTAGISILGDFLTRNFPEAFLYGAYALNFVLSVGVITLLFALMFRYLPDAEIRWRTVWIGSLITALLFTLGKFLLGLYFGTADPGSTYGAAGSLVLILLWVSYSCLILFFGAEFTWVYADRYGHGIRPSAHAIKYKERQVVQEKGADYEEDEK